MQIFTFTVVSFCIISSTLASVGYGPAEVHDSHPNMCYESDEKKYYNPGESWQLTGCGLGTCNLSNHTGTPALMVSYETCGVVAADPPCYTTEDLSLPYPDCCPQIVCPDLEEVETTHEKSQESVDERSNEESQKSIVSEKEEDNEIENDNHHADEVMIGKLMKSDSWTLRNGLEDPLNSIDTMSSFDLGHFDHPDSDFMRYNVPENSDMLKELKVSPRFMYVEHMPPKFFPHWL